MKRSASDAGLPPAPRQLQIPAIPIFNPPAIQPPPTPAPLPPTMGTVQRSPIAIWPQPSAAFFTVQANHAYPPGYRGLPPIQVPTFHGVGLASVPASGNSSSKPLSGSSGRYTQSELAGKTELTVKLATAADLSELADTLSRPTTVTKITVVTWSPKELRDIFDAIRTSLSAFDLEVCYKGPMPEPQVLNSVFSALQERQAPIKSFRWVSNQSGSKLPRIDQFVIEALLTSQLLERIHFSGPRGPYAAFVNVSQAEQLALCVAKHQSLRSLSLKRIAGIEFFDAILKGVANSKTIEKMDFYQINLTPHQTALELAVTSNKQLRSISINDCPLEFGSMSQMLRCMQSHPALESLDFRKAQISPEELGEIGAPIGELLLMSSQIKNLHFRCTLSQANIAALTLGLDGNTSLALLGMEVLEDVATSATDRPGTDAHTDIENMFQSNKGVREIVIRLPTSEIGTDNSVLKSIAKSSSLESLTIENLADIKQVKSLLADNPRIKHLRLKMREIDSLERDSFIRSIHQLADELRDNVNLLSFSITFDPKWDQQAVLRGWFGNLKEAFSKIDDVTTRNRMLSMSSVAGAVMSRRQDLLSNAQGALPALPAELNQLLFETTMNYLSPSDAKKVYNTVLPFTPPPGNQ